MILYPFRYVWWLVSSLRRSLSKPPAYVTFLLESDLPALPDPPRPRWQRFLSRPRLSVKELGENFEAIGRDSRIRGVVLHLRPVPMPMATLQDLRELVSKLRASGKRVVAWAPFYTTGTYYLACACDEILMMPVGFVNPLGFSATGMFLADGLAKFGIEADFVQISPYKSAADMLTKSRMSDELREQITWLLDSQHKELVAAIAESRRLDEKAAKDLIDGSPYLDDVALERHVVDGILAEEQLPDHLSKAGSSVSVGSWDQARRTLRTPRPTLGRGKYVAVLRIEGLIVDGRSARLPIKPPIEVPLVGGDRAGDLSVVQLARQVAADKRAAAAVLYVNSRGGSATASEAMRQALERIGATKPLVVAMGPVAGSGGYWVATPGRWIVARPGALTGSIGVLTGKVVTGGLWSKLLVNRETVAFGEHVNLQSDEKPYAENERKIIQGEIDRIYSLFLQVVGKSRGMATEDVHPIAAGRVWTGRQALERKLVDELGGLDAAVRKARSLASLKDDAPAREVFAPKKMIPPRSATGSLGYVTHLLEGIALLNRAPALAVMNYVSEELA
ncbi:MAG TPA: signal peptide peptidase SppA [Candidatus Dormibacteraeota bacterium]|nr:signal peptide peptidase SppA [Candidatus Dormibacteraeota bacterium]